MCYNLRMKHAKCVGAVFAAVVLGNLPVFAAAGRVNAWVPYDGNPVLGNAKLGTCFDVNVVTDGPAPYVMYFSWRPKKAIALVRSDDAFHWTQEPEICLAADRSCDWEEDDLNRSCTVKKDGVWHMWYVGQSRGYRRSMIGYATSKDGVHFTRVRKDPVLKPEHPYEKESVMNPYVRWDATRGVWRMWYAAGETYEPNVICYAESKDGLNWTKSEKNPVFTHGPAGSWDRDRVGGCEVHPLPDGRWAIFYIGYYDIDTARIGCAISADGVTGWKRLAANPIVSPDLGTWNGSACYKPSVLRDDKNRRWLLWYNGRNGRPEYVGMAVHEGLDLEAPAVAPADTKALLSDYVRRFNAHDVEQYTNAIPNAAAEAFLLANVPRFACPDKEIERTWYFRWWTFRKHLRHDLGLWTVTEFLPNVGWAGTGNTIACPLGHHFREGRWLRDPKYMRDLARFWLQDARSSHRRNYCSWPFTGAAQFAAVSGDDALLVELLDAAVANWRAWEKGDMRDAWPHPGKVPMGGDGKGGFLSVDNSEGSEFSLGGHGYRPLLGSAMWREAAEIARVAELAGRKELADEFARKAQLAAEALNMHSWNPKLGFYTTGSTNGAFGAVRELNGYAPWYFMDEAVGFPYGGRESAPRADWAQLVDPQGFAGRYGLTFPERRASGFALQYDRHECLWNGPSWPYATSIALTAYANDLHAHPEMDRAAFGPLVGQYAAQHRRTRDLKTEGDYDVVPWIDEDLNPDTGDWIARTLLFRRKQKPVERGKDYNHSTFCDIVVSGLVGFVPNGKGFTVDPLCPEDWDYFTLEGIRYRGHDVTIRWQCGEGLVAIVDGKEVARRADLRAGLEVKGL